MSEALPGRALLRGGMHSVIPSPSHAFCLFGLGCIPDRSFARAPGFPFDGPGDLAARSHTLDHTFCHSHLLCHVLCGVWPHRAELSLLSFGNQDACSFWLSIPCLTVEAQQSCIRSVYIIRPASDHVRDCRLRICSYLVNQWSATFGSRHRVVSPLVKKR
jgi:hypothetical protein